MKVRIQEEFNLQVWGKSRADRGFGHVHEFKGDKGFGHVYDFKGDKDFGRAYNSGEVCSFGDRCDFGEDCEKENGGKENEDNE